MTQRPTCAVRGLLHGGRAVCGAVIVSDKSCGFDGQCEHQRQPVQLVECDHCPAIGGCGDKDCRCDAVPFLRELESLLSGGSNA